MSVYRFRFQWMWAISEEPAPISEQERDQLLARLRSVTDTASLVSQIEQADPGVPIEITDEADAIVLVAALEYWLRELGPLPPGLERLLDAAKAQIAPQKQRPQ